MMRDIRSQLDNLYIMIQELSEHTILSFENALNLVQTIADRMIMIKATNPSVYFPLDEIIKSNMLGAISSMMKKDLEVICSVRSGKTKKYVTKDYVIINGDFYREHPLLCATTEPRVMTLEEAQKWVEIPLESRDPVFYEDRTLERAWWIWNADDRRTYLPAIIGGIGRFWTSRPSKKQMEATQWVT